MRNRRTRDRVLRKWRWRIREGSVIFAEQHWRFSKGSVNEEAGLEKYRQRRGGGGGGRTRWTSVRGEEALICLSVTHQAVLSDSESAESFFKRGHKAQGQTNTTSYNDVSTGTVFSHDRHFFPIVIAMFQFCIWFFFTSVTKIRPIYIKWSALE